MNKKQKVNAVLEALSKDVPSFSLTKSAFNFSAPFSMREGLTTDTEDLVNSFNSSVERWVRNKNLFPSEIISVIDKNITDFAYAADVLLKNTREGTINAQTVATNLPKTRQLAQIYLSNFQKLVLAKNNSNDLLRAESFIKACFDHFNDIQAGLKNYNVKIPESQAPVSADQENKNTPKEDLLVSETEQKEPVDEIEPISEEQLQVARKVAKKYKAIEAHINKVLDVMPSSGLSEDSLSALISELTSDKRVIVFMRQYDSVLSEKTLTVLGPTYVAQMDKVADNAYAAFNEWRTKFNEAVQGGLNG